MGIRKRPEHLFEGPIKPLAESIGLRVIRTGYQVPHLYFLTEALHKVRHKLGPLICEHLSGEPYTREYSEERICHLVSPDG
ncbi:hypothetical protein GDO81_020962 [Engystomops pustulosus]|uniref:Uncharacterized protein n=1 Tax=Engystomops pustulosus TaxID=76066 RepID=A0AAV6YZD8_ENGPU|nr:hypothetical protein GDO81_020962 [Engystomops pustulosus]